MKKTISINGSWSLLLLLALLLASPGCSAKSGETLDAAYGRRRGNPGRDSVNGASVLASMFEEAGHTVHSWNALSPRVDRYDVIVWAPDDFAPPSRQAQQFLNDWLYGSPSRTLFYIGRDYDAEIDYWQRQSSSVPLKQAIELQRRLVRAKSNFVNRRSENLAGASCDWFQFNEDQPRHSPDSLSGPWSEGVDFAKTRIDVGQSLSPVDIESNAEENVSARPNVSWNEYDEEDYDREYYEWYSKLLLYSEDDVFAFRTVQDQYGGSGVIVVTNGSFLLNLPLVNHEHRKIAGHLINEVPSPTRVLFLESGPSGIAVRNNDANQELKGWEAFTVWPFSILMLHLAVLGILFCIAVFPIFGRPREMLTGIVVRVRGRKIESTLLDEDDLEGEPTASSNFAKHVSALAKMIARSGDKEYARRQVQQYHLSSKRDSGTSHKEDLSETS